MLLSRPALNSKTSGHPAPPLKKILPAPLPGVMFMCVVVFLSADSVNSEHL